MSKARAQLLASIAGVRSAIAAMSEEERRAVIYEVPHEAQIGQAPRWEYLMFQAVFEGCRYHGAGRVGPPTPRR